MQHYSTIYIFSFFAPTWETHMLINHNNNDPFFKLFFSLVGKEEEEEEDQGDGH